jgi:hypothetical protein
VAISHTDSTETVRPYLRSSGFTFLTALAGWQGTPAKLLGVTDEDITDRYGVAGFPTSVLVGRDGKIIARFGTEWDEAAMKAALLRAGLEEP